MATVPWKRAAQRIGAYWTRPLPPEVEARRGPGVWPARRFEFLGPVLDAAQALGDEYRERVAPRLVRVHDVDYVERGRWQMWMLRAYGLTLPQRRGLCPRTEAAVAGVPGVSMVGYSVLAAGTELRPHRGFPRGILRLHLVVDGPEEGAGLQVGSDVVRWRPGGSCVFDDTRTHWAWNHGDRDRAVLLVDFLPPGRRRSAQERAWEGVDRLGFRLNRLAARARSR